MATPDLAPIHTDGEAYEEFNGRWSRIIGYDYIAWLAPVYGLRWLDVGCGTGALCEVILERCAPKAYVGVDLAEAQLDFARSQHPDEKVVFKTEDALDLSFDEGEFDAAVSALVINFFPDPHVMVNEMKRVVRHSGTVAAWTWDFANNCTVSQHIATAISARRSSDFKRVDSVQKSNSTRPEVMEKIFLEAGLENVKTTSVETVVSYQSFDEYWHSNLAFKSTVSNFVSELTEEDRDRFKAEVLELLPVASDGSIHYTVGTVGASGTVPEM